MTLLALALAAAAAALLVAPPPSVGGMAAHRRLGPGHPRVTTTLLVASVASALVVWFDGTELVLGLVVLGAAAGAVQTWRRSRRRRDLDRRRAAVVEVGEALLGELRAGQPVLVALERGREVWEPLGPVVTAAGLGADVPGALRRLAELPGAEGLREVAAAWQVSQRSGAALSRALAQVVESARSQQTAAHLVRAELASAQATARLVALLPVATLAMSAGIGAEPWTFLLSRPAGLACLALGVALVLTGLWWIDRIAAGVSRP